MKTVCSALLASLLSVSAGLAQDSTAAKIDTMLSNQKALMDLQKKMYEESQYVPPLTGKTAGIELNLARILATSVEDYFTVTGGVSLFAISRHAELAFPFLFQSGTTTQEDGLTGEKYDISLNVVNLDATYRYFLGKYQDGFYFSAGVRYTYIEGIEGKDFVLFSVNQHGLESSTSRFGAYFGLGYRYFTESGFYWGTSFILGRYFGSSVDYQDVSLDDKKYLIDMDFLKFGFAF